MFLCCFRNVETQSYSNVKAAICNFFGKEKTKKLRVKNCLLTTVHKCKLLKILDSGAHVGFSRYVLNSCRDKNVKESVSDGVKDFQYFQLTLHFNVVKNTTEKVADRGTTSTSISPFWLFSNSPFESK